jgi:hypothetical protein
MNETAQLMQMSLDEAKQADGKHTDIAKNIMGG